jgi:hypothetical protein
MELKVLYRDDPGPPRTHAQEELSSTWLIAVLAQDFL